MEQQWNDTDRGKLNTMEISTSAILFTINLTQTGMG